MIFNNLPATIIDHLDLLRVGPDDIVGVVEAQASKTAIRIIGSRCGHLVRRWRGVHMRTDY